MSPYKKTMHKIRIFLNEVGKPVVSFWIIFAIGAVVASAYEWSISTLAVISIFVGGSVLCAINGWQQYNIEIQLDRLRSLGRTAGRIGRPPDFYKKEGMVADVADEIAIMQGWDEGWKEFQGLTEMERATYLELNRRDGY